MNSGATDIPCSEPGERAISQRPVAIKKPIVIGVTGGIASGKSTVARMISGRAILHVDADKIVHQLLQHNRSITAEIAAAFPSVVTKHNTINRAALANHIAHHPEALGMLEAIIHPRVRTAEIDAIFAARRNGLRAVVLDVPLLFETDAHELCDVVIVAHAPLRHRRRRAFARPGMTDEKWQRLLARQLPDHHRHPAADVIIPTTIGKAATRRMVMELMKELGL